MASEQQPQSTSDGPPLTTSGTVTATQSSAPSPSPPQGPAGLWPRIKRHKVVEWALAYVAFAYAVLHGSQILRETFEWPLLVPRFTFFALLLGLPIAVTLAWYHGHRAEHRVSRTEISILAALLLLAGTGLWFFARPSSKPAIARGRVETQSPESKLLHASLDRSIAVLPFVDMSEKHDEGYFADGMAEEILDLLAKIPGLTVIGRTSSFQFKNKSEDLRTIGATLGAAFIVEGSVRRSGPRVRVTAQLIDAQSGVHRWSGSYDRDFGDILALQDEIGTGIARALQLMVDTETRPRRQLNADAYALYLHALELRDQQHEDQLEEAVRELEQALVLDPSFLSASEALAVTHVALGFDDDVVAHDAWQHARGSAEAALRIDSKSAPAHGVLGLVHAEDEFDWGAAESEFQKALALNPRDSVTLAYAALVASARGQFEQAQRFSNASLALDPLNPYAQQKLGQRLLAMRDFAGAEAAFRKSITISPSFDGNHYFLGRMLLVNGQIEAARKEMQAELSGDGKDAGLAMVYHALGRKVESDAALARLIQASSETWPYSVATVYASRGERDKAFVWLEKARVSRDADLLEGIRGDPEFASMRNDRRYKELLRRMNLPET
jgi:TolB-like protein/Tfp pilus assembly protein PilF